MQLTRALFETGDQLAGRLVDIRRQHRVQKRRLEGEVYHELDPRRVALGQEPPAVAETLEGTIEQADVDREGVAISLS